MTPTISTETNSATARAFLLHRELARCVELLKDRDTVEKVILFGTLATGVVHEWSDIDLVVVERTDLPFMRRVLELRKLMRPCVGMDLLVYTPEEYAKMSEERAFVREEIVDKGKTLYERSR